MKVYMFKKLFLIYGLSLTIVSCVGSNPNNNNNNITAINKHQQKQCHEPPVTKRAVPENDMWLEDANNIYNPHLPAIIKLKPGESMLIQAWAPYHNGAGVIDKANWANATLTIPNRAFKLGNDPTYPNLGRLIAESIGFGTIQIRYKNYATKVYEIEVENNDQYGNNFSKI